MITETQWMIVIGFCIAAVIFDWMFWE